MNGGSVCVDSAGIGTTLILIKEGASTVGMRVRWANRLISALGLDLGVCYRSGHSPIVKNCLLYKQPVVTNNL